MVGFPFTEVYTEVPLINDARKARDWLEAVVIKAWAGPLARGEESVTCIASMLLPKVACTVWAQARVMLVMLFIDGKAIVARQLALA